MFAQSKSTKPEASLEIGLGQTDNLNRDNEGLRSDIFKLGVGFAGQTDRRWLNAALGADVEYRKYGADGLEIDDEVLGSIDGLLKLYAVPDIVHWNLQAAYGQVRIDVFGPLGPTNRQWTTSFSTGPQVNLPLGGRTLLQLSALASDQAFEVTDELDARSAVVRAGLARQVDPATLLTLALDGSRTEYELDSQTFDVVSLVLEYRRELASGEAFARIGPGRLEFEGSDSSPALIAQLVWKRKIGTRSRLEICAGQEITDAGSLFAGAGVAPGCPGEISNLQNVNRVTANRGQEVVTTTSPLVRRGGSLSLEIDGDVVNYFASFSLAQDRFEQEATFDNDSAVVELGGYRDFTTNWRGELSARVWIQDFTDQGESNEDYTVQASLARRLARNTWLKLSWDFNRRAGGVGRFRSNDFFLSIGREFGRGRRQNQGISPDAPPE